MFDIDRWFLWFVLFESSCVTAFTASGAPFVLFKWSISFCDKVNRLHCYIVTKDLILEVFMSIV